MGMFVLYCLGASIGASIFNHLPCFMFYIDVREFRLMYNTIREDRGLEIFKEYDKIRNHCFWWNFLGVFIEWIFIIVSIYFAFGFCATYYYQRTTFFMAYVITAIAHLVVLEILWKL